MTCLISMCWKPGVERSTSHRFQIFSRSIDVLAEVLSIALYIISGGPPFIISSLSAGYGLGEVVLEGTKRKPVIALT